MHFAQYELEHVELNTHIRIIFNETRKDITRIRAKSGNTKSFCSTTAAKILHPQL